MENLTQLSDLQNPAQFPASEHDSEIQTAADINIDGRVDTESDHARAYPSGCQELNSNVGEKQKALQRWLETFIRDERIVIGNEDETARFPNSSRDSKLSPSTRHIHVVPEHLKSAREKKDDCFTPQAFPLGLHNLVSSFDSSKLQFKFDVARAFSRHAILDHPGCRESDKNSERWKNLVRAIVGQSPAEHDTVRDAYKGFHAWELTLDRATQKKIQHWHFSLLLAVDAVFLVTCLQGSMKYSACTRASPNGMEALESLIEDRKLEISIFLKWDLCLIENQVPLKLLREVIKLQTPRISENFRKFQIDNQLDALIKHAVWLSYPFLLNGFERDDCLRDCWGCCCPCVVGPDEEDPLPPESAVSPSSYTAGIWKGEQEAGGEDASGAAESAAKDDSSVSFQAGIRKRDLEEGAGGSSEIPDIKSCNGGWSSRNDFDSFNENWNRKYKLKFTPDNYNHLLQCIHVVTCWIIPDSGNPSPSVGVAGRPDSNPSHTSVENSELQTRGLQATSSQTDSLGRKMSPRRPIFLVGLSATGSSRPLSGNWKYAFAKLERSCIRSRRDEKSISMCTWNEDRFPSATELKDSGVRIRGVATCLPDISFKSINFWIVLSSLCCFSSFLACCFESRCPSVVTRWRATLDLPKVKMYAETKRLLRNLTVYEQLVRDFQDGNLRNYVKTMRCLIQTEEDVLILIRSGVIQSYLAGPRDVVNSWNHLDDGLIAAPLLGRWVPIYRGVHEHMKNRWKSWYGRFWIANCSNPLVACSFVIFVLLFLLSAFGTYLNSAKFAADGLLLWP